MALCSVCQSFDIQTFGKTPFHTRGFKMSDVLRRAKRTKCPFCCFLCDVLAPARQEVVQQHEELIKSHPSWNDPWVHLQMSQDNLWKMGSQWRSGNELRFNRMNIFLSPRHVHNTGVKTRHSDKHFLLQELCKGEVLCRVLADQRRCILPQIIVTIELKIC